MSSVALILAGGASRRMGVDKLRLPAARGGDSTVLAAVCRVCQAVADEVWVLTAPRANPAADGPRNEALGGDLPPGVKRHADAAWYRGPLAALGAAWNDCVGSGAQTMVFVVAGDLVGLQAAVLNRCQAALAAGEDGMDAALVRRDGVLQPLCGCYRARAGQAWQAAVEAGERRLMQAVDRLQVVPVDAAEATWPDWWTRPIHTPDDYAAWLDYQQRQGG
ncbi:MAG: NTP transferase domain-containing protein [Alicyclobacillus sp.]|nr:NTP transferase domain-containing protein [Alicyclobacillus sp.]